MPSWSEKELEDWLWEGDNLWEALQEVCVYIEGTAHAKRQVKTPVGIIDILVQIDNRLVVIELKSVVADGNALAQTLDYMDYVDTRSQCADGLATHNVEVEGVIIAPSFNPRMARAAHHAKVLCVEVSSSFSIGFDSTELSESMESTYSVLNHADALDNTIERAWCKAKQPEYNSNGDASGDEGTPETGQ